MNPAREAGPRKALGRGLAALIPPSPGPTQEGPGLRSIAIERVRPNPNQPRKQFAREALEELAESIRDQGVIQPVVVRRSGDGYELVAGERRWRAAAQAGLHEIPAVVKELTDKDALEVALIENLQREDLDPLEEAAAYQRLLAEHGLTQEQVAEAVSKSRAAVANSLRLLRMPAEVQDHLAQGRITAGHARALMTLKDEAAMTKLAKDITARGLSVRDAERQARQLAKAQKQRTPQSNTPAEQQVEERLQRALGTKVILRCRRGVGRIEIPFHSLDHLQALLDQIAP